MITSETIIYQLTVKDIQTVALEIINREFTDKEISILIDPIGDRLAWFDAIEDAIRHCFESEINKYDETN